MLWKKPLLADVTHALVVQVTASECLSYTRR